MTPVARTSASWLSFVLRVVALVIFIIALILAFGWFGGSTSTTDLIGLTDLGLAAWVGSTIIP